MNNNARDAMQAAQEIDMNSNVTVLPDGSAFATGSLPLPKDHWLYAPRVEWDNTRDTFAECPHPILTNDELQAVKAAARYAIRGATMCGQEADFDPDALVQNFCFALCGPATGATLPADRADQPQQAEPTRAPGRNGPIADWSQMFAAPMADWSSLDAAPPAQPQQAELAALRAAALQAREALNLERFYGTGKAAAIVALDAALGKP